MADLNGRIPFFLITAVIGAVAGAIVGGIVAAKNGGNIWAGIGIGAATGGLIGLGAGAAAGLIFASSSTATTGAVIAGGKALFGTVVAGIMSQADRISQKIGTIYRTLTSNNFRYNLQQLTGEVGRRMQAHHVFPQKFESFFAESGININNPLFGAWVDASHQSWSAAYNRAWETFFKTVKSPTVQQIFDKAVELAEEYGFKLNF